MLGRNRLSLTPINVDDKQYRIKHRTLVGLMNVGALRYCSACSATHIVNSVKFNCYVDLSSVASSPAPLPCPFPYLYHNKEA